MPLPLGHTALGLAIYETIPEQEGPRYRLGAVAFVVLLANLPDMDMLLGLLLHGNANLYHRGPTHSLLFALLAGGLAANLWRFARPIPRVGVLASFSLIFSHVLADMALTSSPVSLLWPLQVYWSPGFSGLGSVLQAVLFPSKQDLVLICACALYVVFLRLVRSGARRVPAPALVRRPPQ